MEHRQATIRTIDLGGDKFADNLRVVEENNPAMGLRAIRFCLLRAPDIFRVQLRALLRASVHGRLRIMIPFVSRIEEVRSAKDLLESVKLELASEGIAVGEVEFGVMVELPGAALMLDLITDEIDFASIGTNDLVQYTLGVDRANQNVASLYTPEHPAVLRLISRILKDVSKTDTHLSMCGEMAGHPRACSVAIGYGSATLLSQSDCDPACQSDVA